MSEPAVKVAAPVTGISPGKADWANAALAKLQEQDRKTRRTTMLLTLVPIVVAAGLIYFTSMQVQSAVEKRRDAELQRELAFKQRDDVQKDLSQTREQIIAAQATAQKVTKELEESQSKLAEAHTLAEAERAKTEQVTNRLKEVEQRLKEVGSLAPFAHKITPEDMKGMYSNNPSKVVDAINEMLNLKERGTPFNIDGKEIKDGLNSPMFMAHMLSKTDRFKPSGAKPLGEYSRELFKRLETEKITRNDLQPGDLIYYEAGYTMMYAKDFHGQPFVIGMTPAGILPLEVDFAKQREWYKGIGR